MVKEETIQFIAALKITYLNAYKDLSKQEYELLIDMWQQDFEDIPYKVVMLAFNQYKNSPDSCFPPTAGQLKKIILNMKPEKEICANEAYNLVYKAICNSTYHAEEEWNKLPDEIKSIVSPERLKSLATASSEASLVTFEASFKRDYDKAVKEKHEFQALPLSQQNNLLKLKNMTNEMFNSAVLGNKNNLQIEDKN